MSLFVRIRELVDSITRRVAFLGPILARLCVGITFIGTGWGKLHSLDNVTKFFTELHIPAPALQAAFVSGVEFFGGILIILGLLTRLSSVMLAATMVVAILTAKLADIHDVNDLASSTEFAYLAIFAWLAVAGPGALSLDALIGRFVHSREVPARSHG